MKYIAVPFLLFFALACNSGNKEKPANPEEKEVPAGGPCSYKDKSYAATVVKIDAADTAQINVLFAVHFDNDRTDTVSFYETQHQWATPALLKEKGVTLGAQFTFVESNIVSGSCNPHITRLLLEKYTAKPE